jgi:hypothetical protein
MSGLTEQVESGEYVASRKEIILDSDKIYIELDPDQRELILAYDRATTDLEIQDAWHVCQEFGFHWVVEEYFDTEWNRYVCEVVMDDPRRVA